jgi:pimeloyl-CoA synthetase
MKELTLINKYHQTQERPKPSVEQRVKVMDTLDKKMQTILEKEDNVGRRTSQAIRPIVHRETDFLVSAHNDVFISYSRYANKHYITGVYIAINDIYR